MLTFAIHNAILTMNHQLKKEGKFTFSDTGEGAPIIILHGLMGGLSNFDGVTNFFSEKGYRVLIPELPIYKMSLLKTNVKNFSKYVSDFIDHLGFKEVILLGNSLGGHIGLYCTKSFPKKIKALETMGLTINKRVPILSESNEHNKKYLSTKAQKLGHLM